MFLNKGNNNCLFTEQVPSWEADIFSTNQNIS